jgi:hypothetical protein
MAPNEAQGEFSEYPGLPAVPSSISESLRFKKCIVTPNVGLEFFCENQNFSMSKKIYFGQSLIEVLERLGNPNKEYVKNEK